MFLFLISIPVFFKNYRNLILMLMRIFFLGYAMASLATIIMRILIVLDTGAIDPKFFKSIMFSILSVGLSGFYERWLAFIDKIYLEIE